MSPVKIPKVVHLDSEAKALADLGAARKRMTTKAFVSELIRDEVKRAREIERQKLQTKN